jgi:hypothetical protein
MKKGFHREKMGCWDLVTDREHTVSGLLCVVGGGGGGKPSCPTSPLPSLSDVPYINMFM